jgi:nucleotide-binding universal stress UspA family protein
MDTNHARPIVVATDFSDPASAAFERAVLFARASSRRIVLVHALGLDVPAYWMGVIGEQWSLVERESETHARRQLEALASRAQVEHGVPVEVRIERGFASATVAAVADSVSASVVVSGAQGSGGTRRMILGSTSSRLVRKCAAPVLVVRCQPSAPYRRVLVPIDFSASSPACIRAARHFAPAADLTLLHVASLPFETQMRAAGVSEALIGTYEVAGREKGRERLKDAARHEGLSPGECSEIVESGEPSTAICTHAAAGHFDLIVMGKRGSHVLEPLLLGGVAKHVLAEAECDVLAVPSEFVA